jgi:hypothetical protein
MNAKVRVALSNHRIKHRIDHTFRNSIMEEVVMEGDVSMVKLSSSQYLHLKPKYIKGNMFPLVDLHAICKQRSVIKSLSVIGHVE